jgi:hypothetical protein
MEGSHANMNRDRWVSPSFVEVRMDAEIGSYQDDFEAPQDAPPFVELETEPGAKRAE